MSEFVEVKTAELVGPALDWAVAYYLNGKPVFFKAFGSSALGKSITQEVLGGKISPSTNWAQGGKLIDDNGIEFKWITDATIEAYSWTMSENKAWGNDHLVAACRLVAMELGDMVQVPAELMWGR